MKRSIITKFTAIVSTTAIAAITIFSTPQSSYAENTTAATNASTTSQSAVAWPTAPSVSAGSAILIDVDTGAILYDKDSHTKAYPASITKIMTGLLTIENCSLDETVTFSPEAAKSVKWDEANITTKAGEQYTVDQSLHALLLASANEVAYGLAEHVGGSLSKFVDMMNTRAKELGALNTHFNNASGLSDPNHYTTAYDMAMIGRASFTNSTFLSIDSYVGSYKLGPTNLTSQPRFLSSSNLMFKGKPFYYEYCKGSKTGFTDESGYTLISYAEKDGTRLICVVMKEATADNRYIDTKALFEYGFNNFKKTAISNEDVSSLFNNANYYQSAVYNNSAITFSMDASYVDLPATAALSDVGLTLDSNNTATGDDADKNDYTAKLNFTYSGNTVGSANLSVTSKNSTEKTDNLPYLTGNQGNTPVGKRCFVINIWYVAIGAGIVFCSSYALYNAKRAKNAKRYRKYSKRKLHY